MILSIFSVPLLGGTLAGCATPPPKSDAAAYEAYQEQNDPLQPTNRFFYAVNDRINRYALRPIAKGYLHITTPGIRTHVNDFVTNIGEPGRLMYFAASGKPRDAGTALVRFVVNSTVGIGGIFDPASHLGYPETDMDFGLMLAEWGIPPGPYLYLPILGPSGARDVWSYPAQVFVTPTVVPPPSTGLTIFGASTTALHLVNSYAMFLPAIDQVNATALDPYATFRSLYRQSRMAQLQLIDQRNTPTVPDWFPQPAAQ
jgi:phospholipid-binding lipoprotein MlaA